MRLDGETTRTRVFRALHEIAVALGGVLDPQELARLVVEHARDLLAAGAVGLYTFDEATEMLRPVHSSDAREGVPEPIIPPGSGAAGLAFLLGQPVPVDPYPNWQHAGGWASANRGNSAMAGPLPGAPHPTGA